jgi:hypothetical protein
MFTFESLLDGVGLTLGALGDVNGTSLVFTLRVEEGGKVVEAGWNLDLWRRLPPLVFYPVL